MNCMLELIAAKFQLYRDPQGSRNTKGHPMGAVWLQSGLAPPLHHKEFDIVLKRSSCLKCKLHSSMPLTKAVGCCAFMEQASFGANMCVFKTTYHHMETP
eukprot:5482718-Amphidinium_carterae.2